ncbi:MAG: TetR/AcrR family transcriptional regulator [Verrucomicrobia bacterium]|nr:TetR/AcrR family transcriptional regulator [Verrucomicrobiota bacterium]
MSTAKKRPYNAAGRHARAAETRNRILESAKRLFATEGFECVTIERLAQAAEVSMPTIYGLFQSKRGLLHVILDEALPADQFEALVREAKQEQSPQAHLAISAKIARHIYDAERTQMDLFRSASVLAPEFKELEQERERRRFERQVDTINMIAAQHALKPELQIPKARDILWALTGRDLYRLLVIEQGWTSDEYEEWLSHLLVKTLIR